MPSNAYNFGLTSDGDPQKSNLRRSFSPCLFFPPSSTNFFDCLHLHRSMPRRPRPPPPSRDPRECPQCGIILARPGDLSRHSKTHFDPEVKKQATVAPTKNANITAFKGPMSTPIYASIGKIGLSSASTLGLIVTLPPATPVLSFDTVKDATARKPRGRAEPRPDQALSSTEPRAPSTAVTSPAMSYTSIFAVWSRGPAMP
ncbi:hypothetical protein D9757_007673 [Collybiopsis confluens]|uniref:C2H2-type domain-containing protein n=1 Tax=Collybiopsis confluens TaxID=2823264 RepID=A0A8H5H9W7_9AGAR|nr:hypothetical protein D9757_007673 [Collybiopsis confluens]